MLMPDSLEPLSKPPMPLVKPSAPISDVPSDVPSTQKHAFIGSFEPADQVSFVDAVPSDAPGAQ